MENNKNKKSVKFQGDMLNFCDFIQVFVFTRNHHLKPVLEGVVVSVADFITTNRTNFAVLLFGVVFTSRGS